MSALVILAVIVLVIGVVFEFLRTGTSVNEQEGKTTQVELLPEIKEFHAKVSLLTTTEKALFFEIKKQLPDGFYVFPNMRVADIITTNNGSGYYRRVYKLLPKHIDFLIANQYFRPIVAIELNGYSHESLKQQQIDEAKRNIFKNAGLPLETIRVGEQYSAVIDSIFLKTGIAVSKAPAP